MSVNGISNGALGVAVTSARVISAQVVKTQPSGAVVYFLTLDNGASGEYFAKNGALPFVEGQLIHYTKRPSKVPNMPEHIILSNPPLSFSRGDQGKPAAKPMVKDEAMISSVAIVKSALEGGAISIKDAKAYLVEFHAFFTNFGNNENEY